MGKVIFHTYSEALQCTKQLAMDTRTSVKINKDGNTWWIDDPRDGLDANDGDVTRDMKKEVQTPKKDTTTFDLNDDFTVPF
ncbi:MAG: hypothetical protein K0B14_13555 [Anaerolineaceae bacterium]|nr:hypothetical protein [Anaerolineaceae bacterium]